MDGVEDELLVIESDYHIIVARRKVASKILQPGDNFWEIGVSSVGLVCNWVLT